MPIGIVCRTCDRSVKVKDELAGRKIKCPGCGKVLAVPNEEADELPRRKRVRDQEEDEERPRRKGGKKRSKKGLIIGLSVGGGVLAVGLVILLIVLLAGSRDNPKATEENFDKLRSGMTQEEIEKILGPGEKITIAQEYKDLQKPAPSKHESDNDTAKRLRWKNKGNTILLEIHPPGKLIFGWFLRGQKGGRPIYKGLGQGKLP